MFTGQIPPAPPAGNERWHFETPGEEHHSPIVWVGLAWLIIGASLCYMLWHIARAWG